MARKRRLGRSDLEVTAIGLGTWQFSQGQGMAGRFWEPLADERMTEIVKASVEGGVSWFDTAEFYGHGRSEEALAKALLALPSREGLVVATKWWPYLRRTAGSIRRTIDERLRRLQGVPIDLHQVHHPFNLARISAEMAAMADLVAARKIRAVGVSNFSAGQLRRAHAHLARRGLPLASNQVKYSLLDRRVEAKGVIAAAQELDVSIIAYSPLEQGILTGRFHAAPERLEQVAGFRRYTGSFKARFLERSRPVVEAVQAIAAAHGAKPAQVALAWLVQFHGDRVVAIPGASRPEQARDNAAVLDLALTPAELARLDEVSRPFLAR